MKSKPQLAIKPVSIRVVCDICGKYRMFYRTICRWIAKFRSERSNIKMLLTQVALQQQGLNVTSKNSQYPTKRCPIHIEAINVVDKLVEL